jgi:orotate phosphoribosyltransferase
MTNAKPEILSSLLESRALRFAPAGELFWYTSGTVGPYYINTHYLYGGQSEAERFLAFIEEGRSDRTRFPLDMKRRLMQQVETDALFCGTIDCLARAASANDDFDFDFVSGGERRDWFFSLPVAERLGKPHLLVYKNREVMVLDGTAVADADIKGKRTLHVADLVTEASSYFTAWIPALEERGGVLARSLNVVDRGQGGVEKLAAAGIKTECLLRVDESMFEELERRGQIDSEQRRVLAAYYRDPEAAMREFVESNPDFIRRALAADDERTRSRATMFLEKNPYELDLAGLGINPRPRS